MKVLSRSLMLLFMLLSLVAFACGDDDDDNTGTDTMGSDSVEADTTTGTDTVTEGAACQNDSDLAAYASHTDPEVSDIAAACGSGCFADDGGVGVEACSNACIMADAGLSAGCAGCNTASIMCTISECVTECLADPSSQGCSDCRDEKGCTEQFFTCSGFDPATF